LPDTGSDNDSHAVGRRTVTRHLSIRGVGEVELVADEQGAGAPFLLLHGGAGPASMQPFASLLAANDARVLAPVHPGFGLTSRPAGLDDIQGLAQLYVAYLAELSLQDVTVVGNSVGGWVAAELALLAPERLSRVVLVDAVGVEAAGHPVADVSGRSVPEIMALSFHDPAPFLRDPASLSDTERTALANNQTALAAYAPRMTDPTLAARLSELQVPALVVWGESDGIVDVNYGRAYAEAIPGARFEVLPNTGHVPQLETPEQLLSVIVA
jgi:pimeloyl-ACP methyl ester carboxylesterase